MGYTPFSKLSAEQIESGDYVDINGYACMLNPATNKLERLEDDQNEEVCDGILDQFFASLGVPEGSGIEALDEVIASKKIFSINVTNEPFEGRDQLRISRFMKAKAVVAETSDITA
jgi:hypothetical protein